MEKEGELLQAAAANTKTRFDCQNQILCVQENELMKSMHKKEQGENLLTRLEKIKKVSECEKIIYKDIKD